MVRIVAPQCKSITSQSVNVWHQRPCCSPIVASVWKEGPRQVVGDDEHNVRWATFSSVDHREGNHSPPEAAHITTRLGVWLELLLHATGAVHPFFK